VRTATFLAALLQLAGCTTYDPLYCDDERGCKDPNRPFCDLAGEYPASDGVARTCIPSPFDAGGATDGGGSVTDGGPSDGGLPPSDAAAPCAWGPLVRLANVNSDANDFVGSLDTAGLTLYFVRSGDADTDGVYEARRKSADEAFGSPILLDALSDEDAELGVEISSTGLEIFVATFSANLIETATRESTAVSFGPPSPSGLGGYSPSLTGDGLTMYFLLSAGSDGGVIYRSTRPALGGQWSEPETALPGGGFNSVDVSPDDLRLLLTRDDKDAPLAIAQRLTTDAEFGSPIPLNKDVLVPGATDYYSSTWDASQTRMVASVSLGDERGHEMYYSVCQ
jgi:dipeptidyl aminopeptidase/acylaminoacyl peptidase